MGVSGGCGCLRCCTWETEVSANRGPFFVGMTGFSGERRARWSGSHVQRGGSTHMGARPLPLLMLLFRMIPRFPLTRNARECATPTTPGPRRHQWSRPAAVKPDPCDLQPRDIAPRTGVTECDRSRRGVRPISARSATDLDAELDRSRRGTGPISTRNRTDLGERGAGSGGRAGRQAVRRSGPCGYRPRRPREAAPPRAPGTPRGRPTARPTPAGAALPHWPPPRAQADEARA